MTESFSDGLKRFSKKLEAVANTPEIPFAELFPPAFMARHTKCAKIEDLFTAGGFEVESKEDLEKIDEMAWEENVRSQTSFDSWHDMKEVAVGEWARRKME